MVPDLLYYLRRLLARRCSERHHGNRLLPHRTNRGHVQIPLQESINKNRPLSEAGFCFSICFSCFEHIGDHLVDVRFETRKIFSMVGTVVARNTVRTFPWIVVCKRILMLDARNIVVATMCESGEFARNTLAVAIPLKFTFRIHNAVLVFWRKLDTEFSYDDHTETMMSR